MNAAQQLWTCCSTRLSNVRLDLNLKCQTRTSSCALMRLSDWELRTFAFCFEASPFWFLLAHHGWPKRRAKDWWASWLSTKGFFLSSNQQVSKFEVEAIIVRMVEHMCLDNQTKLTVTMKTALCSSFFASLQRGSDFKEDALAISEQSWPSLS